MPAMLRGWLRWRRSQVLEISPIELVDPLTLPDPWPVIVYYWIHHHPDRFFLPEREEPYRFLLSWDDLRDILVAGGVIDGELSIH